MAQLTADWNGLHPLIVHFAIILLLVAPFLVIVGVGFSAAKRRLFLGSALTLMVLGTAMTYVAVATGELAMKAVATAPALSGLLEEHRSLAKTTTELFSVLTLVFAALLFAQRLLGRELDSWVSTALFAAFLIFYGTGAVLLVNTALKGGHLAHVLGEQTPLTSNLPNMGGR
jgi:uncharacterized membrane protein